jgi:hypothetical protein
MALQILTANIFAESLFTMPSLFHHYQEHKQHETPGIDFLDFIVMHYLNQQHEQSDNEHHSKLPLKDLACHAHLSIDYSMPAVFDLSCKPSASLVLVTERSSLYSFHLPSTYIAGVFQPPRA